MRRETYAVQRRIQDVQLFEATEFRPQQGRFEQPAKNRLPAARLRARSVSRVAADPPTRSERSGVFMPPSAGRKEQG